jgi:hypothetical protein
LNTTPAPQVADGARLLLHVLLDIAKSPALAPLIATPLMVMAALIPLLNVADCAVPVDPTARLAKLRLAGETVTLPLLTLLPVPESATV